MPGEDWKVELSEQVQQVMGTDPEAAEFLRDTVARMRQALNDFEAGKIDSLDDALRSIGLTPVDEDDDEESKTRHDETKP